MIFQQAPWAILLVYIAVFVGALLAFEGLRQVFSRGEEASRARNRRMRMIANGASTEEVLNILKEDTSKGGLVSRLRNDLAQSGLPIGLSGYTAIVLILSVVSFAVASLYLPAAFAAIASIVIAVLLPRVVVSSARKKRLNKLVGQLPEALDLMSRGLKVGHPLNVTIGNVASEMPDPLGTEFGLIQDQISYGDNVVDAFADFADRTDVEDIRYLSVSIGIQHGSGGNLARVLQVLSKVIRDRAMMKKKIVAISAEGRFSAMILSVLPFGIFASISVSSPSFYGEVWDDPLFLPVMGAILFLVVAQAAILFKLVSFKF